MKALFKAKVEDFRLPRYQELPNIGLYLEQVTKYINGFLLPLGCPEITTAMISNYVKKGMIAPPVKKQYNGEQIAYLIFISFGKTVLSIENIGHLFRLQKAEYSLATAYDYFCSEFENMLRYICGIDTELKNVGTSNTEVKNLFRSVIIAISHDIFINNSLSALKNEE